MKFLNTMLMIAVAAFAFTFVTANAADKDTATPAATAVHHHHHMKAADGSSYKEVTYEGNKKITTTYKAIGTRKVGMVGHDPYPVARNNKLADGGAYYTEKGVRYFHDTKKLNVVKVGDFNN